jgi:hypothetical protein
MLSGDVHGQPEIVEKSKYSRLNGADVQHGFSYVECAQRIFLIGRFAFLSTAKLEKICICA